MLIIIIIIIIIILENCDVNCLSSMFMSWHKAATVNCSDKSNAFLNS